MLGWSSKPLWILRRSLRKVWARVVSFAILAVLSAALAPILSPYLPADVADRLGSVAVDQVLSILASSMLAVTTFSLSIAVAAFAAAASTATPRATALLQEDPTTQNVLATFLGAFLFSLIGLIALRTEIYDRTGKLVLFLVTLLVVVLVIVALLRWISHLMSFGRLGDTLDRVERAAAHALRQRLAQPWLGGVPWDAPPPPRASVVTAATTGYVQHIDMAALAEAVARLGADASDVRLHLAALPGTFVYDTAPLAHVVDGDVTDATVAAIRAAFTCGNERSFDQDPRFGPIVLAEIASRALSPAVNDPGTAIAVLGRLVRVLALWHVPAEPEIAYPAVYVPSIKASDLLEDAFRPIARDGAGLVEVQVRLQKALTALCEAAPAVYRAAALELATYALDAARAAPLHESDLAQLAQVALHPPPT